MNDIEIKTIIKALNDNFEKQEQNHKNAIREIQKLCKHTELVGVMVGKQCTICGALILEDRLRHYRLVGEDN